MANKKYIDFPGGTYDITKILLQADPTTGALEKVNLPIPILYTSYVAILTQSGTAAPTATILQNNTGTTFTWARIGTGNYEITAAAGAFTANKTVIFFGTQNQFVIVYNILQISTTVLRFAQHNGTGTSLDVINDLSFEIRIYP